MILYLVVTVVTVLGLTDSLPDLPHAAKQQLDPEVHMNIVSRFCSVHVCSSVLWSSIIIFFLSLLLLLTISQRSL